MELQLGYSCPRSQSFQCKLQLTRCIVNETIFFWLPILGKFRRSYPAPSLWKEAIFQILLNRKQLYHNSWSRYQATWDGKCYNKLKYLRCLRFVSEIPRTKESEYLRNHAFRLWWTRISAPKVPSHANEISSAMLILNSEGSLGDSFKGAETFNLY